MSMNANRFGRNRARASTETMWDFAQRWCYELRQTVRAVTGDFEPDLGRYALVLSPDEYCELVNSAHVLQYMPQGDDGIRIYGVRVVVCP